MESLFAFCYFQLFEVVHHNAHCKACCIFKHGELREVKTKTSFPAQNGF